MTAPPETSGTSETEEGPMRCACGRLLTDPVSRARGLGPRCYRRLHGHTAPRSHTSPTRNRTATRPHQLALDDYEPDWDDEDWADEDPDAGWDDDGEEWPEDVIDPHLRDLSGQGLANHRIRTMTTVPITGSYL